MPELLDWLIYSMESAATTHSGALRKEQQEKEIFPAQCIRLKGERHFA
jgi:hypothetical protein